MDEQVRWLAAARNQKAKTYFLLGVATGMRASELLMLRLRHVWSGQGPAESILIERRYQKHGKGFYKRSVSNRAIPIHPIARAAVQALVAERFPSTEPLDPHAFLFASNRGRNRPLTRRQMYNIIRSTAFAAGIAPHRVSTHSLRKTFAMGVYELSGHDLLLTKEAMQHRSIETTWRYLEIPGEKARNVMMQLQLPGSLPTASPALEPVAVAAAAQGA